MGYEIVENAWALVAMREAGNGWVIKSDDRMAQQVENTSPHIEDLFNWEDAEDFPKGPGLYVWEGEIHISGDGIFLDSDVSYIGTWRRARLSELEAAIGAD